MAYFPDERARNPSERVTRYTAALISAHKGDPTRRKSPREENSLEKAICGSDWRSVRHLERLISEGEGPPLVKLGEGRSGSTRPTVTTGLQVAGWSLRDGTTNPPPPNATTVERGSARRLLSLLENRTRTPAYSPKALATQRRRRATRPARCPISKPAHRPRPSRSHMTWPSRRWWKPPRLPKAMRAPSAKPPGAPKSSP